MRAMRRVCTRCQWGPQQGFDPTSLLALVGIMLLKCSRGEPQWAAQCFMWGGWVTTPFELLVEGCLLDACG